MRFRISSALKDIIGKDLITDDLVAIFELVKNGYDAGAKEVKIIFENVKLGNSDKSKIYIIDNGAGMNKEDIENKWLFVGYSEKRFSENELLDFRNKLKHRRRYAGAKGIGRFSCDRLGSDLKIYTKTVDDANYNILEVDWGKFQESQNEEFQTINVNLIQEMKKPVSYFKENHGTVLKITKLNEHWDVKKLQKLKKYLQRLINPNQVPDAFKIILEASEFKEDDLKAKSDFFKINGDVSSIVYEKLKINTTMLNVSISEQGDTITTILEDKKKFIFELKEKNNEFKLLKNILIKVSYLNTAAKTTFTRLMGLDTKNYGSIFVFKNGFRILPYGEFGDDWLGIDLRKAQGYARFLGNREVLGRIEINGYQPELREVSSRSEGLVQTETYRQLNDFVMKKVIRVLEKYVVEAIDWDSERIHSERGKKTSDKIRLDTLTIIKKIAGSLDADNLKYNKDFLEIYNEKVIEKIPQAIENIQHLISNEQDLLRKIILEKELKGLKTGIITQKRANQFEKDILEKQKKDIEDKRKKSEKRALFLKGLLSRDTEEIIGLQHQIKISTNNIRNYVSHLKLNSIEKIGATEFNKILDSVLLENEKIHSIVDFITQANYDLKASEIKEDLVQFIIQYIENVYPKINSKYNRRALNIIFNNSPKFIRKFKPLDITIILDNLISNSRKSAANDVNISFTINEFGLIISFSDDGKGIPNNIMNHTFEFGFTTTNGSGIGLYHINEILKMMKGTIKINNKLKRGVEFILAIPK
jgi:signal transduction histidine kinase